MPCVNTIDASDVESLCVVLTEERTNVALTFLPLILEGHNKKTGGRCSADAFIDTQPVSIVNVLYTCSELFNVATLGLLP